MSESENKSEIMEKLCSADPEKKLPGIDAKNTIISQQDLQDYENLKNTINSCVKQILKERKMMYKLEQRIIDLERTIEHLTQYPMTNTNDGWYYNNP